MSGCHLVAEPATTTSAGEREAEAAPSCLAGWEADEEQPGR